MRTVSGPIVPVSSGTLPGHSSTTVGMSAAAAGQAAHSQEIRETTATIRFMVAPVFSEPGACGSGECCRVYYPSCARVDDWNIEVTHTDRHPPPAYAPARDLIAHQQPGSGLPAAESVLLWRGSGRCGGVVQTIQENPDHLSADRRREQPEPIEAGSLGLDPLLQDERHRFLAQASPGSPLARPPRPGRRPATIVDLPGPRTGPPSAMPFVPLAVTNAGWK